MELAKCKGKHGELVVVQTPSKLAAGLNGTTAQDLGTTHFEGCYDRGPKHYECALREIERLKGVK